MRGDQRDWAKLILRIPPDLKAWISDEATHNASSQNSEIIRAIRERMQRECVQG